MKKLLKIPVLLFALMLIVSSCGKDTKSDAQYLVDSIEVLESMRDNIRDVVTGGDVTFTDGDYVEEYKTIIKLNEEIIEYNKKLIKTVAYYVYQADEDEFDRFIKDIKELPESDKIEEFMSKKRRGSQRTDINREGVEELIKQLQRVNDSKKEHNKDLEKEIKNMTNS